MSILAQYILAIYSLYMSLQPAKQSELVEDMGMDFVRNQVIALMKELVVDISSPEGPFKIVGVCLN